MPSSEQSKISLAVATIVGMNAMIGAGIFAVPAALASNVGPAGILTFAFVIVAVWLMGSSLARVAELYPQEGSFYTYAKQWGGHTMGLIAAGSYLVGLLIAMGLLAQQAGGYLHDYLPFFSSFTWSIATLILLVLLNSKGVILSEIGQLILICTTIFPLLATIILCLTKANINNLFPFMPYGFGNLFAATKAVIFGFFGFECAASLFNIVENPEKNVSRALTLGIVLVGLLYLFFVSALILAIPLDYFSTSERLSQTLAKIFPHNTWIVSCIHISILSAIIGTVHSMIWSGSSLMVSYLNQFKNKTVRQWIQKGIISQSNMVFLVGLFIFLSFLFLKNIDLFFSFTALFLIFAFTSSIITLLTLPKEWESGRNIITVLGLGTAAIIFYFAVEGIVINLF
jgi:amino acid transporter